MEFRVLDMDLVRVDADDRAWLIQYGDRLLTIHLSTIPYFAWYSNSFQVYLPPRTTS